MRWKFDDGPTRGTTYEHTFKADGTVTYRQVESEGAKPANADAKGDEKKPAAEEKPTKYVSFDLGEGMHLVSYLSAMGWTLTVHVNVMDESLYGFASNDKEWYPITGHVVA